MRSGKLESTGTVQRKGSTNTEKSDALSAYVQSHWEFNDWVIAAAVRYEDISGYYLDRLSEESQDTDFSIVLPSISGVYTLSNNQALMFGIHQGFVPTTPKQDREKRPEESMNTEFGWRFVEGNLKAEIIGFYNRYDNLAETCSMSAGESCTVNLDVQYDAGAVDVYGLESSFEGQLNFATTNLTLPWFVTYTNTQSEFKTSFRSEFQQWGTVEQGCIAVSC